MDDQDSPKMSFIPHCFFGKKAAEFWGTSDYTKDEIRSRVNVSSFQDSLSFGEADYYKYFQCQDFASRPTSSSGVCHTFNALDLDDILKESKWMSLFKSSFKQPPQKEVLKSEGIKSQNGFLFSLGKKFNFDSSFIDGLPCFRHYAKLSPNLQGKV